jgi:hypothetical protein
VRRVIIESPWAGDTAANAEYLRRCLVDSLGRGEAPFASHRMYTSALDDADPEQRERGILAGYACVERDWLRRNRKEAIRERAKVKRKMLALARAMKRHEGGHHD